MGSKVVYTYTPNHHNPNTPPTPHLVGARPPTAFFRNCEAVEPVKTTLGAHPPRCHACARAPSALPPEATTPVSPVSALSRFAQNPRRCVGDKSLTAPKFSTAYSGRTVSFLLRSPASTLFFHRMRIISKNPEFGRAPPKSSLLKSFEKKGALRSTHK